MQLFLSVSSTFRFQASLVVGSMDATPAAAQISSESSASSQPQPSSARAVLQALTKDEPIAKDPSTVSQQIEDLLKEQKKIRAQKALVAKELKNAQRRKARLKHKARLLSASDLATVLVLRQEEGDAKEKAGKKRRSSQPTTRAAQGSPVHEVPLDESASDVGDEDEQEAAAAADPPAQT